MQPYQARCATGGHGEGVEMTINGRGERDVLGKLGRRG